MLQTLYSLDFLGHIAYTISIIGLYLISQQIAIGWLFPIASEIIWFYIGWKWKKSSIYVWCIIYGIVEIYAYLDWIDVF